MKARLGKVLIVLMVVTMLALGNAQQKWEYAVFVVRPVALQILLPDATYSDESLDDVVSQLPGYTAAGNTMVSLLNWFGSNGWELVTVDREFNSAIQYIFKRPQ